MGEGKSLKKVVLDKLKGEDVGNVEENDQKHRDRIEKILSSCKELALSNGGTRVPRVIIRGVDAIYENDRERVSELLAQNSEIKDLVKDENDIKIIAIKKGTSIGRESWIVEAPIPVFRKMGRMDG